MNIKNIDTVDYTLKSYIERLICIQKSDKGKFLVKKSN